MYSHVETVHNSTGLRQSYNYVFHWIDLNYSI